MTFRQHMINKNALITFYTNDIPFFLLLRLTMTDFYESYEYTMVFPMRGDDDGAPYDREKAAEAKENGEKYGKQSRFTRHVINSMLAVGFECYAFKSVQGDELYCLVTISQDKLAKFADKTDFSLKLDSEYCKASLAQGFPEHKIKPIKIADEARFSRIRAFDYIYGKYDGGVDQNIYWKNSADADMFSGANKLKLMYNMLTASKRDGGCRLDIQGALIREDILSMYPSHSTNTIKKILSLSNDNWLSMPWEMPFDLIRQYVGEKMAVFYVFLGFQSWWLIIPMILGTIAQFLVWLSGPNYSHPVMPIFGIFASIWATLWLKYWSREESFRALEWGMIGFESTELERPQFKGDLISSPVNGQFELWYPAQKKALKMTKSYTIIISMIMLVVATVVGIYVIRFSLEKTMGSDASTVASILNSIQITIFNLIYSELAVYLNNSENHKTDTQYQDSLILKVFLFQFVNSYVSFFYIAFIALYLPVSEGITREGFQGQCGFYNCMQPLANNLAIIYATRLTSNNVIEIILEWYSYNSKYNAETHGTDAVLTPPELEYCLLETDPMNDTIALFADISIQFGFSLLFVTALPICFLATFLSNVIRIKLSLSKMLKWHQRPIPMSCEDIGTWQNILNFIAYISVITNGALVCFTMDILKPKPETKIDETSDSAKPDDVKHADFTPIVRVWLFAIWVGVGIFTQSIISSAIDSYPAEVTLQLQRQEFIVEKIIEHMEDDDFDEPDTEVEPTAAKEIEMTDVMGQMNGLCCGSEKGKSRKKFYKLEEFRDNTPPRTADEIQEPLTLADRQIVTADTQMIEE
jgi:hypothetical protein